MKYCLLVLLTCFIYTSGYSQSSNKTIDWGIKAGFNSGLCLIDEFSIDGQNIEHPENIFKVGITGSLFMRLNLNRLYIQTEGGYYFTRGGIDFEFTDRLGQNNMAELSWELNSVGIPVLLGYHLIKQPPYGFTIFAGPKISKIFSSKNTFEIDGNTYPLDYDFKPLNYSLVCGLGINISGLFFDFRYEFGLVNFIDKITYSSPSDKENPFGEIILKNRMNSMSFSMGYMF